MYVHSECYRYTCTIIPSFNQCKNQIRTDSNRFFFKKSNNNKYKQTCRFVVGLNISDFTRFFFGKRKFTVLFSQLHRRNERGLLLNRLLSPSAVVYDSIR